MPPHARRSASDLLVQPSPSPRNAISIHGRKAVATGAWTAGLALMAMALGAPAHAAIPAAERQALIALYNSTDGPNWRNSTNRWTGASGTECSWHGVTCDAGQTHVTALKLNFNNLTGTVPSSLGGLTALTSLNLRQNSLNGPVPMLALDQLAQVDLSDNQFSGPIPSLAGTTALETFEIQGGQLTGSIPALGHLTRLRVFNVSGNRLDGQIGALAGATALETFNVNTNQLTGPIPDLTGLAALKLFTATNNRLTSITALAGLANLDTFTVFGNQLAGAIPPLTGLARLRVFEVQYNQLSGPIPPLDDLANLETLHARDNQLTGQIPALSALTRLRFLQIQNNRLVGSPPMPPNNTLTATMCPNPLRNSADSAINAAWDPRVGNGNNPWATGCTGSWDVTPSVRDANSGDEITDGSTGTISPATTQILASGDSLAFTMTPAPGYRLRIPLDASCPGSRSGNVFTAGPMTANCYVNVAFVPDASSPEDGVCGADDEQTLSEPPVNLCTVGTPSAISGTGPWTWSCAGVGTGTTAQCSAQKAGGGTGTSITVTAVVTGAGGTATPASQSVASGARATITAAPDEGYRLASATGCGGTTVSGNTVSTAPVIASCTVTLTFSAAAVTPDGAHAVPTLAAWGLALMAALLGWVAALRMRRTA